ncbi:MAG: DUF6398 domain-containing protein [Oscillospiraceae bacterium]|nr:DUF6398 domain-containing protein [Oscillospiraceae bacterium]
MNLSQNEVQLFYKLWYVLIWSLNEKHKIVPIFKKPVYGERTDEEPFIAVRAKLWENPQWIDDFLRENEFGGLTEIEHGILKSWSSHFVKGQFIVMKHLKPYSVFMTFDEPAKLYGVCGISNPIKATAPYEVPYMVDAVLLPFKDKIIYDSFIGAYPVSFGKGIRDSMKEIYEKTKETVGIIENMDESPVPVKPSEKAPKPAVKKPALPVVDAKGANVPKSMSARYMEIAEIIGKFCDEKLNNEYKEICLKALAKLCRKRPSPIETGKANTWACGIVYAIGATNFIFDKSQSINMTAGDIAERFGLSKNTAGGKAAEVKNLLDLSYFNTEFSLKSHIDSNPMIWYLKVNGYLVDIRTMPRGAQEEAFRKGLIPYIPADEKE